MKSEISHHEKTQEGPESDLSPSPNKIETSVDNNLIEDDGFDEEQLEVLNSYKFTTRFEPSKGPRRRKRFIICGYEGCDREFTKAWNFLDHARMHTGERPYECEICQSKFTQRGNLTKHMKKHSRSSKKRKRRIC